MTYNSYFTDYDLYYISSVRLEEGATVAYGEEIHTAKASGNYRILFTPGEVEDESTYLFDDDGNYGSGDSYKNHLYIEDAPEYFITLVNITGKNPSDLTINDEVAYPLLRVEESITLPRYRGALFFSSECEFVLKYRIYEKTPLGGYVLIDDDRDEDTTFSKLTVSEVGNYTVSFDDGGDSFSTAVEREEYDFGGFYALGNMNGWGFDPDGELDLDDAYKFELIEETDEDYDEDYDQYRLTLLVTPYMLKESDVEFIITDGEDIFMNLSSHIILDEAGEYEILFSDEHDYGRGRNYLYSLSDEETEKTEIVIETKEDYFRFVDNCNSSADYSKNAIVYLAADIDFGGDIITPIKVFNGIFRGGYHKLSGFTLDEYGIQSVFGTVTKDGTLERLNVELKISAKDKDYVGFVGKNYGKLSHITVSGEIEGKNYVGAVVAYNGRGEELTGATQSSYVNGTVNDCTGEANITGYANVGGVAGFNNGNLDGCTSRGAVSGKSYSSNRTPTNIGGLVGYSAGRILKCENHATVSSSTNSLNVGGIAGQLTGDVYYSFNYGKITGTKYVGGIAGYYGTITEDEGDLGDYFGGMTFEDYLNYFNDDDGEYEQIDGRTHAIYYTVNEGEISAKSYVGGIVGYSEYEIPISLSVNTGNINATGGGYAGGIIGEGPSSVISECISGARISASAAFGAKYVGGIAGRGNRIFSSMSSAEITADDYVGGIAGYQISELRSCYSNALVIAPDSAEFVGAIAGYSEAYSESQASFGANVSSNYYIGSLGGITRLEYGSSFDHAASRIDPSELSSQGMLSPALSEEFMLGNWIASEGGVSYPQPKYMNECAECDYFNDDEEFEEIFNSYKERFSSYVKDSTAVTFTVSFLEWNTDYGDLYDDDNNIDHTVFEVIHTERLPYGDLSRLVAPDFIYAEYKDGVWISSGSEANYFASFTLPTGIITENLALYASYNEVATTVATEDSRVLAEGRFIKGTTLELVNSEIGYSLVFKLNGEEIHPSGLIKVKFLTDKDPAGYSASKRASDGAYAALDGTVSGKYIAFELEGSDIFVINAVKTDALPTVAVVILSVLGGAILTSAAFVSAILIRKRCAKKNTKTEE